MRTAWRIARSELRGSLRAFRIFLASLALGVAAIAAVGLVKTALQTGLEREGATLLGGDAEAELTYRFADAEERAFLDSVALHVSETVSFRSLATTGAEDRALTEVQAVDDLYPLLGAVTLDPPLPLAQAFAGQNGLPGAVIEPALAERLALEPGDIFRLGTQDFMLMARLIRWPDNATGGFGLGPRTMVLTADLAESGLIAPGTLFSTRYRLDLPEGADAEALAQEAAERFRDRGLQWQDASRGAAGMERAVEQMGAFLTLIGLAGLAVGGIGVSAAVRAWLDRRVESIAILRSLGATGGLILTTCLMQIALLSLAGILIGLALGAALPLLMAPTLTAALPVPAVFALYPAPLVQAALYGFLVAMLFTLWPLARIEEIRPAALFRDAFAAGRIWPRWPWIGAIGALLAALIGAAMVLTGAPDLALWTACGIAVALALLALAALFLRLIVRAIRPLSAGRPALRLALAALGQRGGETGGTILSLGLGLAVLAAVGQIDGNLRRALIGDLPAEAPSFFFVDIQPDQITPFLQRINGDPAVTRVEAAPMLRGIITEINHRPAEETAGDHWVIRGDRGVTYSDLPPPGTRITAGEWWAADHTGPAEISFSAEEAAAINLALGDTVTVNILGRDVTGTVTSFREVAFESAGIGFVIAMNPAALAGAPHSWIATVYAQAEAEAAILNDTAGTWPNITAIGIREAVERAAEIIAGIAIAVRVGALVTLAAGFLVLIGAAAAGERARAQEAAITRSLGATRGLMLGSFALRALLTGTAAGVVALAAGMAGGWAVMDLVMEAGFRPIWPSALAIIGAGAGVSLLAGLVFALRPLSTRPAQVLRARD